MKAPKLPKGKITTFVSNPKYEEVLVFVDLSVPTSQVSYKLIDSEKQLYERIEKKNIQNFRNEVKDRLLRKRKEWWPLKGNLNLKINVSGPKNYVLLSDLDNYLKTIFDALKGIVFEDDNQIISVEIEKKENPFISGFYVAIETDKNKPKDSEVFTKLENSIWELERSIKLKNGGISSFDVYI